MGWRLLRFELFGGLLVGEVGRFWVGLGSLLFFFCFRCFNAIAMLRRLRDARAFETRKKLSGIPIRGGIHCYIDGTRELALVIQ